jgi:hypothetical protein
MSMVEGAEQFWHVRGDHHDPIVLVTDGVVVGLFLVVIIIGAGTAIVEFVRRPLS